MGDGSKHAKKVNSELSNSQTRPNGLVSMKRLLETCDENVLSDNIATWIKSLSTILLQKQDAPDIHQLAVENFKVILSQASQVSSISREISTNLIPAVLTNFLQGDCKDADIVSAIESVLVNYPSSCGNLRSKIVKVMLPLMESPSEDLRSQALRCWSQVPFLGGGGSQRSTHSQQWQAQFGQTIKALKFAYSHYVGEDSEETLDPCIGSLSLPFSELPVTEPELSHTLILRISTLLDCMRLLLDVDFPFSVPIPTNAVMKIIFDILDVTPKQMGNTSEMLLRASYLHGVQGSALQTFGKLTKICKRNLCRFSSKINRMFSALLDLWKDQTPTPGKYKRHHFIRTQIYSAITDWVQNCGAISRFLSGPTHLNQSVLNHLVDDIIPVKNILKVSSTKIQKTGGSKKAKKRKFAEATQELLNSSSGGKIQNSNANAELNTAALKVAYETVKTMIHRLSPDVHKVLQETVILLLLHLQQGITTNPYSSCVSPRMMLYKVLLTLTLSPVPSLAPPTALSAKIFTFALSGEKHPDIRSFCTEAMSALSNFIHPWRSAWHICSVEIDPEKSTSSKMLFAIEPINTQKNGNDLSDDDDSMEMNDSTQTVKQVERSESSDEEEHSQQILVQPLSNDGMSSENRASTLLHDEKILNGSEENCFNTESVVQNIIKNDAATRLFGTDNQSHGADVTLLETETVVQDADIPLVENLAQDVSERNSEDGGNPEEVERMILDFVAASPQEGDTEASLD